MALRYNLARMESQMGAMRKMGGEGLEIAKRFEAFKDELSEDAADYVDGMLGLAATIREDLNPLTKNIIDITDLPALVAQTIIRVVGALRPTKQQAETAHKAFTEWRQSTKPANRTLIDAMALSFGASIERWIDTLEDEPTSGKPLSADKV